MEKKKRRKLFSFKCFLYDFVKLTGILPVLLDLRLKRIFIEGKKPKGFMRGKYIIASNHVSFDDPVIITNAFAFRRVNFVANKLLLGLKFWGKFFKGIGCIEVDKDSASIKTFKKVKERIDEGRIVAIFPEGTIEQESAVQYFKTGVIMMSLMCDCDIVPTYIIKRKNRFERQVILIGNKFRISDYISSKFPTMDEINMLASKLRKKEEELLDLYNSKYKKN